MNATNLESLIAQWKEDGKIDKVNPEKDLLTIPNLHAKYAAEVVLHQKALKKQTRELTVLKRLKYRYYDGKLSKEELEHFGWEQFQFVIKTSINHFIDSDKDVLAQQSLMDEHEDAIDFCKMVVRQIQDRTWQIKSFLDFSKYTIGV